MRLSHHTSSKLQMTGFLSLILGFVILIQVAIADVVVLTNGKQLVGEIIADNGLVVRIQTPTGTFTLNTAQVVLKTKEPAVETQIRFGDYYFERKDFARAITAYQKALAADTASLITQAKLGQAEQFQKENWLKSVAQQINAADDLVQKGQLKNALAAYAELTTLGLDTTWQRQVQSKMADVYVQLAQAEPEPNTSELYLQQALELYPDSIAANFAMGMLCSRQGKVDKAQFFLERAVALDPQSTEKHIQLGQLYLLQKNYLGAAKEFELAKQLSPARFYEIKDEMATAYLKLGEQKYQEKKFVEARNWLEKYTATNPGGDWTLYYRAQYQLKSMEIDPNSARDRYAVAQFCIDKKLYDEAQTELKAALRIDPGYELARSKLVELYDRFAAPIFQIGTDLLNRGNYDTAIDRFSEITTKYPLSNYRVQAEQKIANARQAYAKQIYEFARTDFNKGAVDKTYYDRAYDGFSAIVENFPDFDNWQSAKQMRDRTFTELQNAHRSPEDIRDQKVKELVTYIDSVVGPDQASWRRILELASLDATEFERNMVALDEPTKRIIRQETGRLVYLFYNQLTPLAEKMQIRSDRVRTDRDRMRRLELTLYILASPGGDYPFWMEIKDFFGGGKSEFDESKSKLSTSTQQRIDELGSQEIYRVLNLR